MRNDELIKDEAIEVVPAPEPEMPTPPQGYIWTYNDTTREVALRTARNNTIVDVESIDPVMLRSIFAAQPATKEGIVAAARRILAKRTNKEDLEKFARSANPQ